VIAATAKELGADLVTLNVKHFPMFPGLRAPYRSAWLRTGDGTFTRSAVAAFATRRAASACS
jgi:hypothetical protein